MKSLNQHSRQFSVLALVIALALSFFAVAAPAWSDHDQVRNEIRQFHDFLQDHPKVSTELRSNPKLVNSNKYLAKHDDLEKFLKRHPDVKRELVNHPSRIFGNYYRADQARWSHHH